jgi:hypothetical protein
MSTALFFITADDDVSAEDFQRFCRTFRGERGVVLVTQSKWIPQCQNRGGQLPVAVTSGDVFLFHSQVLLGQLVPEPATALVLTC